MEEPEVPVARERNLSYNERRCGGAAGAAAAIGTAAKSRDECENIAGYSCRTYAYSLSVGTSSESYSCRPYACSLHDCADQGSGLGCHTQRSGRGHTTQKCFCARATTAHEGGPEAEK